MTVSADPLASPSLEPVIIGVLTMFDAVDHIVACYGIHAQARQAGINRDVAFARCRCCRALVHALCYGEIAVTDSG